ncbi:ATP-binding protein [Actinomadura parmotrematis]|uniref:LuxR C-terminal-related transcriptional regulator n=1 Tax=Actinomadura parmotrematis TaxID=2864039 RepID=A0ABS7FQF9_9ACTN|nr:LuxR C-terminal-related transcriptional regulator [Actinomadura parmotrematis]MBW8482546.1 LuxR C-terminal-related transcriptional regulator [Actinomadura parmotrematis]
MTPLKTPATPADLPVETDTFIGRDRDVADLCGLLETLRAVTLTGPGGIGKTRLAVRVARTLAGRGAGPVWFVELADVRTDASPDPVGRRVAAALQITEEEGRSAADSVADALGARPALLVLDNCEHLVEGCASLAAVLLARCPGLRLLATSREPLRMAGETVWRVPPLDPADAVRLFVERARAVRPDFAATGAVAEVSRALDGLPLALELAAARVRVLSVEQIAERLEDRFKLLSAGDRDRTAPLRQRTLRAAIDWSHDLLSAPERVLLRRLAVFAGWTLGQAEQVCADDGPFLTGLAGHDLLDLLTALVDKSLVVVGEEVAGETRFRLLESIRQYAAEQLAEAGEETEVRDRHRDAVLEGVERDGEIALAEIPADWAGRVALFRRYDVELGNVRAALAWTAEHGGAEEGLRICTGLRTYWITRGRVAEWTAWTDRFLAAGDQPAYVLGPALAGRAQLAVGARDFAQAAAFAERALEPCGKAGDDFMTAIALVTLAEAHTHAGRLAEAAARLDEADAVGAAEGQEWNRAYARIARGYLRIREGRLREAGELLETGLAGMREIGQLWGAAHALIGLARLAALRGDHAAARACYAEALPVLGDIGARPESARALSGLGRVALAEGDLPAARRALAESLELSRATGIRLDVARCLEAFAALLSAEGDARGAVLLAGAAGGLRDATGRAARPAGGARMEAVLQPLRRALGEPLVARLWAQGRVLSSDAAAELALRDPGDAASPPGDAAPAGTVPAPREPAAPPSTLTAREREIARLVARGLSNRAIADELVISPATVARHVTNILTKLGFGSRAQVAAWSVDHLPPDPHP